MFYEPTDAEHAERLRCLFWQGVLWACNLVLLAALILLAQWFYSLIVVGSLSLFLTYLLLGPVNALERFLAPLEEKMVRWRWLGRYSHWQLPAPRPRIVAVLLVFTLFMLLLVFGLNRGLPGLIQQLQELWQSIPGFVLESRTWLSTLPTQAWSVWVQSLPVVGDAWEVLSQQIASSVSEGPPGDEAGLIGLMRNAIEQVIPWLVNAINLALENASSWVMGTLSRIIHLVALLVLTFYLLLDGRRIFAKLKQLVPEKQRPPLARLGGKTHVVLQAYIKGQVLLAILTGFYMFVVYSLFGIKFAFLLGIFFTLAELLPVVGTWLGITPGLLICLYYGGPWVMFWVFICSYSYQTLKDNIIAPKITGDVMGLHPVVVILSLLLCAKVAGLLGILLAIPLAGMLKALLETRAELENDSNIATASLAANGDAPANA